MIRNEDILSPKEALTIGNVFFNTYSPYKHHKPREIICDNPKEELMLKIQELSLMVNDLGLYLDLNPHDKVVFVIFKKYNDELVKTEEKYCVEYEPLNLADDYMDHYKWYKNWPWEGKNV